MPYFFLAIVFICLYLKVLIPKLKEPDPNPSVTISVLHAIGEQAQVSVQNMKRYNKCVICHRRTSAGECAKNEQIQ